VGYEHFRDGRVADRGIPSFQGKPADTDIATFFGNPGESRVRARVNVGTVSLDHQAGGFGIRNRTSIGDYDRGYQNFVPGSVTPDKTRVALSAYNNTTQRRNGFNQTDLTYAVTTGRIRHLLLAGGELGRQSTDNLRNTGYFHGMTPAWAAPYDSPTIATPMAFRPSATDPDNRVRATLAAAYLQDQLEISSRIRAIGGIRFDSFDLQHHNNRTGEALGRVDRLVSPRVGVVYMPITSLSVYASYSISHLPGSGDQFSSLTSVTQQLKPERFTNHELGVKWDFRRRLSLSAAAHRLDRTNTRAVDPSDPTRIVQTGSQRTTGCEFGWNGNLTRAWDIAGGYAYQDAIIASATAAARAGARVALVPRHSWSLWNNYRFHPRLGGGLGVSSRSDVYAAVDNSVTLPGYTRVDAALFFYLAERVRLQVNVENAVNQRYFAYADGNNNISPGSPRAVRVALTTRF
jgi:catecholate siderophore receptor